jgi:uncharacterized protein (TIGR02449 family)
MLEELDALTAKLTELAERVRVLREENQRLRVQATSAASELSTLRERVTAATSRIDALLARLPRDESTAARES